MTRKVFYLALVAGGVVVSCGRIDFELLADSSCPAAQLGMMQAYGQRAGSPRRIDGLLTDWPCPVPLALGSATAQLAVYRTTGITSPDSTTVVVAWDPSTVYIAAHVTDPDVVATSTDVALNDAFEIFLGMGTPTGDYSASDHHWIVDALGVAKEYSGAMLLGDPRPGFTWAAQPTATGYDVEAAIASSLLSSAALTEGLDLPFDVQLDDGDGQPTQYAAFIWIAKSHTSCVCASCCCNSSLDYPYCDTLRWGTLHLGP